MDWSGDSTDRGLNFKSIRKGNDGLSRTDENSAAVEAMAD